MKRTIFLYLLLFLSILAQAQVSWLPDGSSYAAIVDSSLVRISLPKQDTSSWIPKKLLTDPQTGKPVLVESFAFSKDLSQVLLYANSARVWRQNTRGDYYLWQKGKEKLVQIGRNRPSQSLMFAKLSPDGARVAYVCEYNLYVEDLKKGTVIQLTKDGTRKFINGTFDWAYEEEFSCRDGFRWSPDSKSIAYWQVDARSIRDHLMINNTDSVYSYVVPVEYPKVGQKPSSARIGVVSVSGGPTTWMNIPGDPSQRYLVWMDWVPASRQLLIQQLNRRQNETVLYVCNTIDGRTNSIFKETDEAWIETQQFQYPRSKMPSVWLNGGKEFVWLSEKDGWRHAYRVSLDGKKEKLITTGAYDMIRPLLIDEKNNTYYFKASPDNATQDYLYQTTLDGTGKAARISPATQVGTHAYDISPNGTFALHRFSNARTNPVSEWITMSNHTALDPEKSIAKALSTPQRSGPNVDFFKIKTEDGVEADAWMVKPEHFDPAKKYPIVFLVYGEPIASMVLDSWGTGTLSEYVGNMAKDGYIYASIDNRGTPSPKGAAWRRAIYRNIGTINIRDLALGARAMFGKFPFIDTSRVAVHGWSGGGASTLNLLFQYPDLFQTGIAGAAISNQFLYDNIYQERYMGQPQENPQDFIKGSPVTHAKNLRGNLLYIHGTGDDNVHYQNAEVLINELVRHNKQFQLMAYPNRNHFISDNEGSLHLATLFTAYLKQHCPPGPR